MSDSHSIVIIGSGLAGYTLIREIRKLDSEIDITLICADSGDFYSKPMLSNALDKGKSPDTLISKKADEMAVSLNFTLLANTRIEQIKPEIKTVCSSSKQWKYDKLVLAIGAKPVTFPIQGNAANAPVTINNLDDYRTFYPQLQGKSRIAIIGPGLIGCEFANDLASQQIASTLIGPDPWPISTLLPQPAGEFLQQRLELLGIEFNLGNTVSAINSEKEGYQLTLNNGSIVSAELVLSAIGLRAETQLAQQAGLKVSSAISTNELGQTSDKDIFALGDCAEIDGSHLPFIMPIMQASRSMAATLLGNPSQIIYPVMPIVIKTPACPLVVCPPAKGEYVKKIDKNPEGVSVKYYKNDDLKGFVLAGDQTQQKQALTRQITTIE